MKASRWSLLALFYCIPTLGYPAEASKVFKLASPSVVVVHAYGDTENGSMQGSGVIVEPLIVSTSCHVLTGANKIIVTRGRQSARTHYVTLG